MKPTLYLNSSLKYKSCQSQRYDVLRARIMWCNRSRKWIWRPEIWNLFLIVYYQGCVSRVLCFNFYVAIVLLCCINSCIGATCMQTRIFDCPPVFIVRNVTRYHATNTCKTAISILPPPPSYKFSSSFCVTNRRKRHLKVYMER